MRKGRIDYRMQRRALLGDVNAGHKGRQDVCDAHPDLLRAAVHIGSPTTDTCPICADADLTHVTYVFEGKGPRSQAGRALPREALARHAQRHGDLTVYTVEVCTRCHWHHLVESFLLEARDTAVG